MELTVLGCRGSTPYIGGIPERFFGTSSYLVISGGGTKIVLDVGMGADSQLHRRGLRDSADPPAILLSHRHPDHQVDLVTLAQNRLYPKGRLGEALPPRESKVELHGPLDTIAELDRSTTGFGYPRPLSGAFDFHPLQSGTVFQIGDVTVTPALVDHLGMDAYGFRLDDGQNTVVYSGDTGPCGALVTLAEGAGLALFEAFYANSSHQYDGLHLTGGQAAETARRADVGKLLLTHHHPSADAEHILAEAAEVFPKPLASAAQDVSYEVAGEQLAGPPPPVMDVMRANQALYNHHIYGASHVGRGPHIDWGWRPPARRSSTRDTDTGRAAGPRS